MISKEINKIASGNRASRRNLKKNKTLKIVIWSFIITLMFIQVKEALYQTKTNPNEATIMQKVLAREIMSEEEYLKIVSAETDALESKIYNPEVVSRGGSQRNEFEGDFQQIGETETITIPRQPNNIEIKDVGKDNVSSNIKTGNINVSKEVMEAITKTSKFIDLDIRLAKTLIHTESGYVPSSECGNKGFKDKKGVWHEGSTDYGLTQINNRGGVIEKFLGKKVDLADGRKQVLITSENYKKDMYLNLFMGLSSYKRYYFDLCSQNPYIAYACYNAGESSYMVFKNKDKYKLSLNEVCSILTGTGRNAFIQASRNVRNNFAKKYDLYFN